MGKWMHMAVIALALVFGGIATASAQITEVPGVEAWCPSTGGPCYPSIDAAETALRAAVPDVGHLLVVDQNELPGRPQIVYRVPDQPPASYGAPWYGGDDYSWNHAGDCPNSQVPVTYNEYGEELCYDEAEMIASLIENLRSFYCNPQTGSNCNASDFTVVGEYDIPYTLLYGSRFSRGGKHVEFYRDIEGRPVSRFPVFMEQPFVCPAGMSPVGRTTDTSLYPKVCWSNVRPYIYKTTFSQRGTCAENVNPCNPGTGDKFRAEFDFTFGGHQFFRYYHSNREVSFKESSFGMGWTHTFSGRVFPYSGYILTADGTAYSTTYAGGRAHVPGLKYARIDEIGDDRHMRLTEADGTIRWFTLQGQPLSIGNRNDPTRNVVFHYTTINGKSLLTEAVDAAGRELKFTYDEASRISKIELPDGSDIDYGYDAKGNLTSVDYGGGQVKSYHYAEPALAPNGDSGLLTGISSEDGSRYANFGYDSYGRVKYSALVGDTGPAGETKIWYVANDKARVETSSGEVREVTYFPDPSWHRMPTLKVNAAGSVSSEYDWYGRLMTRYDARGYRTAHDYSNAGLIETVEATNDGSGTRRTTQTDWHATFNLPVERRVLNASGVLVSKRSWSYNDRGQVLSATQFDVPASGSRTSTVTYCEQTDVSNGTCPLVGLVTSTNGSRTDISDTTAYTYYATIGTACGSTLSGCGYRPGDLWKVTDALGRVSEILAYDAAGRPLAVKDANGVVSETLYYPRGWVATVTVKGATSAGDRITSYEYWPTGLVKKITDPDGVYTSYEYDNAQRLTAIADSAGNRIEYTLDGAGNRIGESTKGAGGTLKRTLSRVYNTLGQLATQADAQANPTDFTYDANGNSKTVTDALGHATSNDYDPLNRLKRTLQDVGGIEAETKFTYDANDNLTKVTDPKGLDTTYTYNGFGDQVQLSSPDTGITSFTYDSAGNRASQTDARGITTTYQYDALNRLTQVGYPTTSLNVAYTYDVTQPVCQAGETFSIGRLTLMVDGSGSTQYCHDRFGQLVRKVQTANGVALTLQYAYTKSGQLQAMTYPDGTVADYVRNTQGQVTGVGVTRPGQAREVLLHQATYHPFGPIAGWVYGNGRTMQRNVDLDYRPTSIQGGAGGLDLTYGYDEVGNLTSLASGSPPPMEYGYDALGRLTETRDAPTQAIIDQYAYDKTGNRTSYTDSLGTKAYAYPSTSHRLSSVAGENRTYDAVGNTLSIGAARAFDYNDAGRMSQVRNGGVVAMEYAYNGRGEQVRKHLGATETQALYDEAGHWLGDYGTSGVVSQQAIWMDDMPVGVLDGGQLYYIQPDHLGTPRAVIDPVRNVAVWRWDSKGEAFGNTSPEQDADGDGIVFALDMRFPGQRYDDVSEINYNYFRDYDSSVGRYVQSDPTGLDGGISTYGYVGGQPLFLVDPTGEHPAVAGLCFVPVVGWGGCAIVGATVAVGACYLTGVCQRAAQAAGNWLDEQFGSWSASSSERGDDSKLRDEQYQAYKDFQRAGYKRDPDPCKELRNRIEFFKKLVFMRKAWDQAWPINKYPGGRHQNQNGIDEALIQQLEQQYQRQCPNECK